MLLDAVTKPPDTTTTLLDAVTLLLDTEETLRTAAVMLHDAAPDNSNCSSRGFVTVISAAGLWLVEVNELGPPGSLTTPRHSS
jgi:hypothetical protein